MKEVNLKASLGSGELHHDLLIGQDQSERIGKEDQAKETGVRRRPE